MSSLTRRSAEPLEVKVFDDWSMATSNVAGERPLQLAFTVNSPEIVMVATVNTIPKMMSYANKFKSNVDAQRQAAARESKTYWATRTPKPDNPLSAVAEAMFDSARSRFRDFEPRLSYTIHQNMTLRLDLLRLVIFPRSMNDVEIAHFVGQHIHATFDRIIGSELQTLKRDLHLSFSSLAISKHTHHHPDLTPPTLGEGFDGREWIQAMFSNSAGATIVGLPAMKMHMISEEHFTDGGRQLVYDFQSRFMRKEGMRDYEDIFITLNMSLYAWLTVLRKNLTREMAQVQATEEWRTSMTATVPSASAVIAATTQRKKVPEPLDMSLSETTKSATLPPEPLDMATNPTFLSPLSAPSSARYPSLEQTSRSIVYPQPPRSATTSKDSLGPTGLGQAGTVAFPLSQTDATSTKSPAAGTSTSPEVGPSPAFAAARVYIPRDRHIERLTMRQLGEATPDVMHPFFMKKAGFNLEDSLPQYVHEYAAVPLEEIMEILFKLYSQQLLTPSKQDGPSSNSAPSTTNSPRL